MKQLFLLVFFAATSLGFSEPPARIDISKLPKASTLVDDVVVPVPSEIFAVLDKLGPTNWTAVLRPMPNVAKAPGEQAQTALMLGTVIAEGFIAVEAEDPTEVKNIGKSVLKLAQAIGVREEIKKRSKSITDYADQKNWTAVRKEFQGALADVRTAMLELNSEPLSQLVSLGGWLRGTEALTSVVTKNYTKDGAELLHQPMLLEYFDRRLNNLKPKVKADALIVQVRKGLQDIRPLVGAVDGSEISEKSVNEISVIAEALVKSINSKAQ